MAETPKTIDLPTQLKAARRELNMRKRVYPRWVESRRMKEEDAWHEIAAMEAIAATLAALVEETSDRQTNLLE